MGMPSDKSVQRPRFSPAPGGSLRTVSLSFANDSDAWTPLVHCTAKFPPELFEIAISQLIHHPEYNSTLILRSEIVVETTSDFPDLVKDLVGYNTCKNVHRKLLPRRPGRDAGLEQHCTLYRAGGHMSKPGHALDPVANSRSPTVPPSILVFTPIVTPGSALPYYHPSVSHLAFRYIPDDPGEGVLQIEVVPLPGTPTDLSSRLYRTCLALLETLHRYGWGALTNYKKRVKHDCIVPREEYQDLYLIMRERHKYLANQWKESTDPLKHVFEDISIATFIMLLWKQMYPRVYNTSPDPHTTELEPWHTWGRPRTGFLDLGCGNGLLTHILVSEGYSGHGVDVRARISWDHYPGTTQASLHVEAVDPTSINSTHVKPGVFMIGNHADELTPWVPVLSTLCDASGYLSIPCCPWTFDAKYERSRHPPFPVSTPANEFIESLALGGDGSNSSAYSMYRIWLASLHTHCGWTVECETLRIPSTRNWALVGRCRQGDVTEGRSNARRILEGVKMRGTFKARQPEGKAG